MQLKTLFLSRKYAKSMTVIPALPLHHTQKFLTFTFQQPTEHLQNLVCSPVRLVNLILYIYRLRNLQWKRLLPYYKFCIHLTNAFEYVSLYDLIPLMPILHNTVQVTDITHQGT